MKLENILTSLSFYVATQLSMPHVYKRFFHSLSHLSPACTIKLCYKIEWAFSKKKKEKQMKAVKGELWNTSAGFTVETVIGWM